MPYLIRNAKGKYLVSDDEFSEDKNMAYHFCHRKAAERVLEKNETIEEVEQEKKNVPPAEAV